MARHKSIIMIIHGMWANGAYSQNYRNYFEERGYRCITPTLRHHDMPPGGPPDPRLGRTSVLDYVADLEAQIRNLDSPPFLVGHSMGGLLTQMLAERGLARAVILLTPASPAGILSLRISVLRSFLSCFFRWGAWRKPIRQTFGEWRYSMYHLLPAEQQRAMYEEAGYESGRAACEIGFWLLDPRRASRVDERRVNCPMLVVGAKEDRITPVAVVRKVAGKYGAVAAYKEFPGHAHAVMHEAGWEEIARYCADWLARLEGSLG